MRSPTPALAVLAATVLGLVACSSSSTTNGSLGFTVAESLLVLDPLDSSSGYVILSSGTGNCPALQSGGSLISANVTVGNVSYLVILLGAVDANANFIALTAGDYTILDPTASFNPPGLLANAEVVLSDATCVTQGSIASGGTATLLPFDSTDGGSSTLNYSAIFASTQVTGTYALTTCLVPDTTPLVDAGTCAVCVGGTADGGACAIP
jgi:hypothetical protein